MIKSKWKFLLEKLRNKKYISKIIELEKEYSSLIANSLSVLTLLFTITIFIGYTRQQDNENDKFNKLNQGISKQAKDISEKQKQIEINSAPFVLEKNNSIKFYEFIKNDKQKSKNLKEPETIFTDISKAYAFPKEVKIPRSYLRITPKSGKIISAKWFLLIQSKQGNDKLGKFFEYPVSVTTEKIDESLKDGPAIESYENSEMYSGQWYFTEIGINPASCRTYYFLLITAGDGKNYLYAVTMSAMLHENATRKDWFPSDTFDKSNFPMVNIMDFSDFFECNEGMGETSITSVHAQYREFGKIYESFKEKLEKQIGTVH